MERSIKAMNEKKVDLALKLLDDVVELAPDFTEGWNRRAYVYFVQNDIERALGDLRRTLALDPHHFKALDGLAQILREIGQKKAALKAFKELLEVHPYWSGAKQAVEELEREVEGQGI
jgi:tetratricopeptide (TPR) repeat protein